MYTGPWALFDDGDTSKEGQTIREALEWRIMYRKGGGAQSEEVTLLKPDEYQSSEYLGDLGDFLGISNNKDELQGHTKRIRIQKYLREKLLPPH